MSRLFTFFEILSHNLAFVCAPPPTIHHRPYATLVLPTSARLSPRWGNTTLCAAIVCDNTPRSIARIAQTRYALHATAISLRSIRLRHALLPMRAIRAFVRVYRPAGAIRRSARLLSATIHRALSPASRKRDTRSMLRLFRCAQYAYAMRYCPCGQYAHLCTAISLRSIRRASSAMRSIDCLHSIPPYEPYLPSHRPHIFPTYSACAENLPAPRQILKIVEKKRLTYCFLS